MVDDGAIIWADDRSDGTVEAALTLARIRFGDVAVFGDDAYVRQCREAAERLGIEIEVITVAQALRRADRSRADRDEVRRSALEHRIDPGAEHRTVAGNRRRAWVRAYSRAAPIEDLPVSGDGSLTGAISHHLDIPVEAAGSDAVDPQGIFATEVLKSPKAVVSRSTTRDGDMDR